jgi:hypothetical protein
MDTVKDVLMNLQQIPYKQDMGAELAATQEATCKKVVFGEVDGRRTLL